jgi:hypothetical protein
MESTRTSIPARIRTRIHVKRAQDVTLRVRALDQTLKFQLRMHCAWQPFLVDRDVSSAIFTSTQADSSPCMQRPGTHRIHTETHTQRSPEWSRCVAIQMKGIRMEWRGPGKLNRLLGSKGFMRWPDSASTCNIHNRRVGMSDADPR